MPGAEDALADAFASALAVWPNQGAPSNPEGWLATAARRRLIDAARRRRSVDRGSETLVLIDAELKEAADAPDGIPDRRLALMFACAHPAIEEAIRAPLMLQTILGLDAAAIASAFLVSPAAMGQYLQKQADNNQLILQQASDFLTPEQLASLGAFQTNMLNMQKMGMSMKDKFLSDK